MEHTDESSLTIDEIKSAIFSGKEDDICHRLWHDGDLQSRARFIMSSTISNEEDIRNIYSRSILEFITGIKKRNPDIQNWRAYFTRICKNLFYKEYHKTKSYQKAVDKFTTNYEHNLAPLFTQESHLEEKEQQRLFLLIIKKMANATNKDCEQIFLLWFNDFLSHEEIAEKLNISNSSSRTKLKRCLDKIKAEMSKSPKKWQIVIDILNKRI